MLFARLSLALTLACVSAYIVPDVHKGHTVLDHSDRSLHAYASVRTHPHATAGERQTYTSWQDTVSEVVLQARQPLRQLNSSQNKPARTFVTLLTSDKNYLPAMTAWLVVAARHSSVSSVILLALDKEAHDAVRANQGHSVLSEDVIDEAMTARVKSHGHEHFVWLTRMVVARHILTTGTDLLMTDLDALWLRDPLPMIAAQLAAGNDVVASRAHGIPLPQKLKWGSTACMGFVYFRADDPVRAIMNRTVLVMLQQDDPDDQIAFNEVSSCLRIHTHWHSHCTRIARAR